MKWFTHEANGTQWRVANNTDGEGFTLNDLDEANWLRDILGSRDASK